ncbi:MULTISPECIES: hypothetical protein [unclassified Mesorhizobium]|uniref:hypothetical protein n=1 Tax=unclassified Mesorhizobium TaxID=325217 RepID=UPI003014503C
MIWNIGFRKNENSLASSPAKTAPDAGGDGYVEIMIFRIELELQSPDHCSIKRECRGAVVVNSRDAQPLLAQPEAIWDGLPAKMILLVH